MSNQSIDDNGSLQSIEGRLELLTTVTVPALRARITNIHKQNLRDIESLSERNHSLCKALQEHVRRETRGTYIMAATALLISVITCFASVFF